VATDPGELAALAELERRGTANGLAGLRRMGPEELREREPHVAGAGGLLVPDTGIVDFARVTAALAGRVRAAGGEVRTGTRLLGCRPVPGGLVLETNRGPLETHHLVNCGGLQSDRIARLCGVEPGLAIVPFRGDYWHVARRDLVRHLVYPVPDPAFPFLGVHFTRTIHGHLEAGPNAVLALRREGYARTSISPRDVAALVAYGGFWRMAGHYWRTGAGELYRAFSRRAFVAALRHLVPALEPGDLRRAGAGVRAQAVLPDGRLADDFRIAEGERTIHVLNAPSPAATASLAIGQTIAGMAARRFDPERTG